MLSPDSFATPWAVAHQAPLSMEFSGQEYWSWVPFPSPGDLPDLGIKLASPALSGGFFTTELPGKPVYMYTSMYYTFMFKFYNKKLNHRAKIIYNKSHRYNPFHHNSVSMCACVHFV